MEFNAIPQPITKQTSQAASPNFRLQSEPEVQVKDAKRASHHPTAFTASFKGLPAVNFTALLALMIIGSPVEGLRPERSGRSATAKLPKPINCTASPLAKAAVRCSSAESNAREASAFERLVSAAMIGDEFGLVQDETPFDRTRLTGSQARGALRVRLMKRARARLARRAVRPISQLLPRLGPACASCPSLARRAFA